MNNTSTGLTGRQFFIDWLRVGAFTYLILYHISDGYVDPAIDVVGAYNRSDFITLLNIYSHQWRMSLVFLLSGCAISFMVSKYEIWHFIKERTTRLGIPLLVYILTFNILYIYSYVLYFNIIEEGFNYNFLNRYFTQTLWTNFPQAFYVHLWYLVYLWIYIVLSIPFIIFMKGDNYKVFITRLDKVLSNPTILLLAPCALFFTLWYLLSEHFPESRLVQNDFYLHAQYFSIFVMGLLMTRMTMIWDTLERYRWLISAGAVSIGFYYIYNLSTLLEVNKWTDLPVNNHLTGPLMWTTVTCLLAWAKRLLNRPHRLLNYANNAVFPFYIIHYPFIFVIAYYVTPFAKKHDLSTVTEFSLTAGCVFISCWILYEFVIRRVPYIGYGFGYKKPKPKV